MPKNPKLFAKRCHKTLARAHADPDIILPEVNIARILDLRNNSGLSGVIPAPLWGVPANYSGRNRGSSVLQSPINKSPSRFIACMLNKDTLPGVNLVEGSCSSPGPFRVMVRSSFCLARLDSSSLLRSHMNPIPPAAPALVLLKCRSRVPP